MESFQELLKTTGKNFVDNNYSRVILVGDYDTDGIAALSIIRQACDRASIPVTTLVLPQLDSVALSMLDEHEGDAIVFLDMGSNDLDFLEEIQKDVYILDHHNIQGKTNHTHLNPLAYDIHETISAAGIAYWFALGMDNENKKLVPLAILGALGDTQERGGFSDFNKTLLQHALVQGCVAQSERLRLFGLNTRPLTKVLMYSTDLQIPGVTNNFHGAKKFLQSLSISWSDNGKPRKYVDLTTEEEANLIDAILERKPKAGDEDLYMNVYEWKDMPAHLSDLKELATIINSCGRLGEYDVALNALEGSELAQSELATILQRYKQILHSTFSNLKEMQSDNQQMFRGEAYVLFDLDDTLPPSMAGIIASMLARNKHYPRGTVVGVITRFDETREKLSLRTSYDCKDTILNELLSKTFPEKTISTGGHTNAAGAVFNRDAHDDFIERLQNALKK